MKILLLAEVSNGVLALDQTAKAVKAAGALGGVTVLCASAGCGGAAEQVAALDGVDAVLCADNAGYAHGLAEPVADLIVSLAGDYTHIIAPATTSAKNIMPRVAALLDVMVISDITAIIDAETFERPIYAGNAIQTVRSGDAVKVLTVRTAGFDAAGTGGGGRGFGGVFCRWRWVVRVGGGQGANVRSSRIDFRQNRGFWRARRWL